MGNSDQGFNPVSREIPFESPSKVYERLKSKNSILLESIKGPENIARYSYICTDPYLEILVSNGHIEITAGEKKSISSKNPLERLRELLSCYNQLTAADLPPFQGGAAGVFNYDFLRYIEQIPKSTVSDPELPDAHLYMFDRIVAFDHELQKAWIVVCPWVRSTALGFSDYDTDISSHISEAEAVAAGIAEKLSVAGNYANPEPPGRQTITVRHDVTKDDYIQMVIKAKEYIAAGDIFQANLSLRFSADIGITDPWRIYKILSEINPAPFAFYADFGDYQLASSSPERLVRCSGSTVDMRPIAGTRPRGRNSTEDEDLRTELLLNEKERAEHIMLIDLERNDLGRVADFGSVHVSELMVTEDYSHVIHIVSNVVGSLSKGMDNLDIVAAVFPGGTITGVPKVRCMEIIDQLEKFCRGPYTGSAGYIGYNGCMDLNIIIRTFLILNQKAYIQAGAGIVADSDPEREYNECVKKAEALLRTLDNL